jgi:hypothetical protein
MKQKTYARPTRNAGGDSSREFTAILFRNSGTDIRVLRFYWK